jgi:hypothetical protein
MPVSSTYFVNANKLNQWIQISSCIGTSFIIQHWKKEFLFDSQYGHNNQILPVICRSSL